MLLWRFIVVQFLPLERVRYSCLIPTHARGNIYSCLVHTYYCGWSLLHSYCMIQNLVASFPPVCGDGLTPTYTSHSRHKSLATNTDNSGRLLPRLRLRRQISLAHGRQQFWRRRRRRCLIVEDVWMDGRADGHVGGCTDRHIVTN